MKFFSKLAVPFITLFWVVACNTPKQEPDEREFEAVYSCDVETIDRDTGLFVEKGGKGIFFENIKSISTEFAHSGQHSIKLFPGNPYGLTTGIDSVLPDDYLVLTVWKKGTATGVLVADGGPGFYYAGKQIAQSENGWEQIWLEIFVPPTFKRGKFRIYAWNNSQDTLYFDDLNIVHRKRKTYPSFDSLPGLAINLDQQDIEKMKQKRLTAFETEIMMNSDEDYAGAILFDGNRFLNSEVRLKGDLTDHLQGEKWSFRIKLKNDFCWKRMRTFSVQNPQTRYYLHEWLAHKILDQEGLLTTRYGFLPVVLNNRPLGIYAYEEHFEKQLLESRNRREGPIVRFDEDVFWHAVQENNIYKTIWDIDYFAAARVVPFREGTVISDSLLSKQFIEAQNLLNQYRDRKKPVSQILDVDKLARYYALLDLTQAYHGFVWHNQRFYYNPVTCLLERIAFDGYIENGFFFRFEEPFTGLVDPVKIKTMNKEQLMLFQVFADSLFNRKYIGYLEKYSDPSFIENIVETYLVEADSLASLLRLEFPYYRFDFEYLEKQAAVIRENIPKARENVSAIGRAVAMIGNEHFVHKFTEKINRNLILYLVHANYDNGKRELAVTNFSGSGIEVKGALPEDQLPLLFEKENTVAPWDGLHFQQRKFAVKEPPVKVYFGVGDSIFEIEVKPWPAPDETSSRMVTIEKAGLEQLPVNEKSIRFDGKYTFKTDVVIPAGFRVEFAPGAEMDLVNGAGFISFSPVNMSGTAEKPVEITSSDNSANGFNVLQPGGKSVLKYVHFSGLGSLRKGGWQSPAAVNFYEADADITGCRFENNSNCDDALNMVRSEFDVKNCIFRNTFADAFDSDFCTGKVSNCTFEQIGNDAIDFSGSVVTISDCTMTDISDKAVSGGEESTLTVLHCNIDKANIGVASKDLSLVQLRDIDMKNVVYGFAAFIKKPEYGPAKIEVENLKLRNKIVFHKIEEGSTLRLNGKLIPGREKKLALKLYQ